MDRISSETLVRFRVGPNITLKLIFTAFLLDAQPQTDNVENKPARLVVVPLGKEISGILSS